MNLGRRLLSEFLGQNVFAEREPVKWQVVCPEGHRAELTDKGGIRIAALGAKRVRGDCARCGQRLWLGIERKA